MKTKLFLFAVLCVLVLSAFNVKSQEDEEPIHKSLNDTLVIDDISKELYICTCKPNTSNPAGKGDFYYQGKWKVKSEVKDSMYFCDERFLVQWDLSELPKGIEIIEAKMRLVCAEFNGDQEGQLVYERICEPWNADIGYSEKPKTLSENRVVTGWPTASTYHYVDITDFVKAWYYNKIPNYGLMGLSVNTETNNSALFCSSKYPKESVRPKLIVIFSKE